MVKNIKGSLCSPSQNFYVFKFGSIFFSMIATWGFTKKNGKKNTATLVFNRKLLRNLAHVTTIHFTVHPFPPTCDCHSSPLKFNKFNSYKLNWRHYSNHILTINVKIKVVVDKKICMKYSKCTQYLLYGVHAQHTYIHCNSAKTLRTSLNAITTKRLKFVDTDYNYWIVHKPHHMPMNLIRHIKNQGNMWEEIGAIPPQLQVPHKFAGKSNQNWSIEVRGFFTLIFFSSFPLH